MSLDIEILLTKIALADFLMGDCNFNFNKELKRKSYHLKNKIKGHRKELFEKYKYPQKFVNDYVFELDNSFKTYVNLEKETQAKMCLIKFLIEEVRNCVQKGYREFSSVDPEKSYKMDDEMVRRGWLRYKLHRTTQKCDEFIQKLPHIPQKDETLAINMKKLKHWEKEVRQKRALLGE